MSPPDDTPPLARLVRWSEWWFTPRWRALLTWFALTTIAVGLVNETWFYYSIGRPIEYLNRFLPAPLPPTFRVLAEVLTRLLLVTWFEPLALRLSLRRGLAWIGLTFAASIVPIVHSLGVLVSESMAFAIIVGIGALQCGVLRGWRNRPWMCLPARALTAALMLSELQSVFGGVWHWLNAAVVVLPGAALLLYGTRLLRAEERAGGGAGK